MKDGSCDDDDLFLLYIQLLIFLKSVPICFMISQLYKQFLFPEILSRLYT